MGLDLPQLLPQVQSAGRTAAERLADQQRRLPQALSALEAASKLPLEEIQSKIARAGPRWVGAEPIGEPVDAAYPPPPHPGRMAVLAADGSQIHPDRHAAALYYLINIGSIRLEHGSGTPPETHIVSELFHSDEDLSADTADGIISPAFVNATRDIAELAELVRLSGEVEGEPALALLDNSLILWLALQVQDQVRGAISEYIDAFLRELSRMSETGASLAGLVDRPRHANVASLLDLLDIDRESGRPETPPSVSLRSLTDRHLFAEILPQEHRSAVFAYRSPVNREFDAAGHEVHFFYLNTGEPEQVVRVEVPAWVVERNGLLDCVHAGIVEECRATGGYPYTLVRAHELAVVTHADRQLLEGMLNRVIFEQGMRPRPSLKSITKTWTGARRRHRV